MTWRKREIMEMARESGFNVQGDLILDDLGYVTLTVRIEEFARIVREEQQTEVQRLIALVRAQQITIDKLEAALAQPEEEPLHPVHIGVDVTQEGTTVTAFYRKPDAVMEMFYLQFHPMAQPAPVQEPLWCNHCNGSGRMVRDPDIGTDQECFVCDGAGVPAAPVQEPVAWTPKIESHYKDGVLIEQTIQYNPQGEKLPYPQHTWVGLDFDEFKFIASKYLLNREAGLEYFQEEIEAKLRSKNEHRG